MTVDFYEDVRDEELKFAVIPSKHNGQWLFCRHRDRDTYEFPGGHREEGEQIGDTAGRELYEETGALSYTLHQLGVYGVTDEKGTTYGMLFFADIHELGPLPEMEIGEVKHLTEFPDRWTYPAIQPVLLQRTEAFLRERDSCGNPE